MAGKREVLMLMSLSPLLVACGDSSSGPEDEEHRVVLHVVGTVTSEPGDQPIEGATVDLGWGGHVSLPVVRATTSANAEGIYEVADTVQYQGTCPFLWMRASASGYASIWSIEDSRVAVSCVTDTQVIDIPLEPAP
jgi:hypothetical protein